jgi:nucleotide-binding universal stress UspA family protein
MNLEEVTTTTKGNTQETIIKKILIAIDESEYREKIISYGLTLAKSLGAGVTAIHVIDRSSLASLSDLGGLLGYYEGGNITYYEKELRKHAKELLGEVDTLSKKTGVKINTEVIMNTSSVAEGIINYASSRSMDLIVIGTKGMTGMQKSHMGRVADKVTDHAHCTVMVVR